MSRTIHKLAKRLEQHIGRLSSEQRALAEGFLTLMDSSTDGRVSVAALCQHLCSGSIDVTVDVTVRAHFLKLREHLNRELAVAGANLQMHISTGKYFASRTCWIADLSTSAIDDVYGTTNFDRSIALRVAPRARALVSTRIDVPISYSHADKAEVGAMHARLQAILDVRTDTGNRRFRLYRDERDVRSSAPIDTQISALFDGSPLALFMLSIDFLKSNYCMEKELPKFIAANGKNKPGKYAIVVGFGVEPQHLLSTVPKRIAKRIVLYYEGSDPKKSWRQLLEAGSVAKQDDFLHKIADEIIAAAELSEQTGGKPRKRTVTHQDTNFEAIVENCLDIVREECMVAISALPARLSASPFERSMEDEHAIELLPALVGWATDVSTPPFCALLGEFGSGKTVACQMLVSRLAHRYRPGLGSPKAVYFDLRRVDAKSLSGFTVENIIEQLLKSADVHHLVDAREFIDQVREVPTVVVFDGLDEVLVHLDTRQGQDFTRALHDLYAPRYWQQFHTDNEALMRVLAGGFVGANCPVPRAPSKLLLSCRNHYFRTFADQEAFYTHQGRDQIECRDYRAFVMLPFADDQIRDYLRRQFPARDPDIALGVIRSIYNLEELARRPVMLKQICHELEALEYLRKEGKIVNTAVLYGLFIKRSLGRDDGKHQFSEPHKHTLMEQLALELARRGVRELAYDRVEAWLDEFIAARPVWESAYRNVPREVLKEDLRTATFIVRPEEKKFRFAHTSLQEYFLARALLSELMAGEPEAIRHALASRETQDFFIELWHLASIEGDDRLPRAGATLASLLETAVPGRSERAFSVWLALRHAGCDPPQPKRFDLSNCDFSHWRIGGHNDILPLANIDLRHAILKGCVWHHVDMHEAQLDDADARDTEWQDANLDCASVAHANFTGATLRKCDLKRVDLTTAECTGARILLCGVDRAALPNNCLFRKPLKEDSRSATFNLGHFSVVNSCAFSPDGNYVLSASVDTTLRLWNIVTRQCECVLAAHEDNVLSCTFSPDGLFAISASADKTLRLWNLASRQCEYVFAGHEGPVLSCAFSLDGLFAISASADRTLRVWKLATRECVSIFTDHDGPILSCAISPNGKFSISASADKTLRVWKFGARHGHVLVGLKDDAQSGDSGRSTAPFGKRKQRSDSKKILKELSHRDKVHSCAISPDGHFAISGSADKTLCLWNLKESKCEYIFVGHEGPVLSCAFSPDGRFAISASADKTLRLWDLTTRKCVKVFANHVGAVQSCAFSLSGRQAVSASEDKTLRLWNVDQHEPLDYIFTNHQNQWIQPTSFSPDGRVALSASADGALHLWDLDTNCYRHVFTGHRATIESSALSFDSRLALSASTDKTLRLWNIVSGECEYVFPGQENTVRSCAFSPDGQFVVYTFNDSTLHLWNVLTRQVEGTFVGHSDAIRSCVFSPDGHYILTASDDNTLRLWTVAAQQCERILVNHLEARDGTLVLSCAFSADGRHALSGSSDGVLRIWNLTTDECEVELVGHNGSVRACAFSYDGRFILSASNDKTLRLWNRYTKQCEHILTGHTNWVTSCAFLPDGKSIVSGSRDGAILVHTPPDCRPQATLRHLPGGEASVTDHIISSHVSATPGAWRYLTCEVEHNGEWRTYPAEVFGPIPEMRPTRNG